nr:MAG TPA: hypothetical protein [Caudoviricetes sp.]
MKFCIIHRFVVFQKNAFSRCKGNEYFFNYQNNSWKTRKSKRTFQSLKDSIPIDCIFIIS